MHDQHFVDGHGREIDEVDLFGGERRSRPRLLGDAGEQEIDPRAEAFARWNGDVCPRGTQALIDLITAIKRERPAIEERTERISRHWYRRKRRHGCSSIIGIDDFHANHGHEEFCIFAVGGKPGVFQRQPDPIGVLFVLARESFAGTINDALLVSIHAAFLAGIRAVFIGA